MIARHSSGTPAITYNQFGKGHVLFIGTNAGEAYNTGHFLSMGKYREDARGRSPLSVQEYEKLVERYKGWQTYAILLGGVLKVGGVQSPVKISVDQNDTDKARVSLQAERAPGGSVNHLLVITLEPIYNPVAEIQKGPDQVVAPEKRVLKNLTIRAKVPDPQKVKAIYGIPPIGYEMGRINAIPERIPFQVVGEEIQIVLPEVSEVACLLVARDSRPLIGVKSDDISTQEGRTTRVLVTVDNAAGEAISGEITYPPGFRANGAESQSSRFDNCQLALHCQFDVLAPFPVERHRTFQALVNYRRQDGKEGTARSYPVTSRTDERIAWGWVKRVEADMAEAAAPPTPWGNPYEEALQKREFVYAAYNNGDTPIAFGWRESTVLCRRTKELKTQRLYNRKRIVGTGERTLAVKSAVSISVPAVVAGGTTRPAPTRPATAATLRRGQ